MKTLQKFLFVLALLAIAPALATLDVFLVPLATAQIVGPGSTKLQQTGGYPWQLGGDFAFNSSSTASAGFDTRGISYYRILWIPNPVGGMSGCTLSLDSATAVAAGTGALVSPVIGGILPASTIGNCLTAGEYVTSTAAGISAYGQITPTITGTGSVIVILFGYTDNPSAAGGSASSITSPVDGNGYIETNCKVGCAAGTPGQQPMAASQPVVIASNQSTLNVAGTFFQATQPVSLATAPTTPVTGTFYQATQPVSLATAPNTPSTITSPVDGSGNVKVNCETGCAAGTPGQATMAASQPVVIASNQSTLNVAGTFFQSTQPVSIATMPTTPVTGTFYQATQPVSMATAPTTPVTGIFYQSTQPVSLAIAPNTPSSVISPVDGSGYVETDCKVGCSGGTPGQATMAASQPVVIASNQSTLNVAGAFYQATQPISMATAPTTPTQPAGFGAAIDFTQAVTTTAVALASNAAHSFSVCASPNNTISVFIGPSSVTTSGSTAGLQLEPGQCAGWPLSNTNLRYVISTTTGASVSITGV
jgi:hypothetical protein